ncbi:MAG: lipoprotein-releasing ABC transporter permease subunit, partial [Gammaproteobacteria bacterium]|nr:lipoprotein-releasing ABC transporter permease subunit [Gammaproteobacteria bacterium]
MFRPLEFAIGLRYTRAKRRNHFISFISLTSMLGIALGVTALITVLSVMNGFEKEVRGRILDMVSHLTVSGPDGRLHGWSDVVMQVKEHPQVIDAAPYVEAQGMLIYGKKVNGALIRGILPAMEPGVSNVADKMVEGQLTDLKPGAFEVILGRDLARILRVDVGDKVTMVTPSANITPAGVAPRLKRFKVVGIFYVGMYEYDSSLAIIHLDDARRLFRLQDAVTGVRAKLKDLFAAPQARYELQQSELGTYWVRDWSSYHANWFRAVKIEKRMIFLLLLLIIAVAAFNIVSTLVMLVTDKESDIAILRTLGATPKSIMGIFMVQGTLMGVIGTILGVIGGISLSLNLDTVVPFIEKLFGFQVLDPGIYYISELPSDLHWDDVWLISGVSFLFGVMSTLY